MPELYEVFQFTLTNIINQKNNKEIHPMYTVSETKK